MTQTDSSNDDDIKREVGKPVEIIIWILFLAALLNSIFGLSPKIMSWLNGWAIASTLAICTTAISRKAVERILEIFPENIGEWVLLTISIGGYTFSFTMAGLLTVVFKIVFF